MKANWFARVKEKFPATFSCRLRDHTFGAVGRHARSVFNEIQRKVIVAVILNDFFNLTFVLLFLVLWHAITCDDRSVQVHVRVSTYESATFVFRGLEQCHPNQVNHDSAHLHCKSRFRIKRTHSLGSTFQCQKKKSLHEKAGDSHFVSKFCIRKFWRQIWPEKHSNA